MWFGPSHSTVSRLSEKALQPAPTKGPGKAPAKVSHNARPRPRPPVLSARNGLPRRSYLSAVASASAASATSRSATSVSTAETGASAGSSKKGTVVAQGAHRQQSGSTGPTPAPATTTVPRNFTTTTVVRIDELRARDAQDLYFMSWDVVGSTKLEADLSPEEVHRYHETLDQSFRAVCQLPDCQGLVEVATRGDSMTVVSATLPKMVNAARKFVSSINEALWDPKVTDYFKDLSKDHSTKGPLVRMGISRGGCWWGGDAVGGTMKKELRGPGLRGVLQVMDKATGLQIITDLQELAGSHGGTKVGAGDYWILKYDASVPSGLTDNQKKIHHSSEARNAHDGTFAVGFFKIKGASRLMANSTPRDWDELLDVLYSP
jgi:hypothetical protein